MGAMVCGTKHPGLAMQALLAAKLRHSACTHSRACSNQLVPSCPPPLCLPWAGLTLVRRGACCTTLSGATLPIGTSRPPRPSSTVATRRQPGRCVLGAGCWVWNFCGDVAGGRLARVGQSQSSSRARTSLLASPLWLPSSRHGHRLLSADRSSCPPPPHTRNRAHPCCRRGRCWCTCTTECSSWHTPSCPSSLRRCGRCAAGRQSEQNAAAVLPPRPPSPVPCSLPIT